MLISVAFLFLSYNFKIFFAIDKSSLNILFHGTARLDAGF